MESEAVPTLQTAASSCPCVRNVPPVTRSYRKSNAMLTVMQDASLINVNFTDRLRSCGKVMFSRASVNHSIRERGVKEVGLAVKGVCTVEKGGCDERGCVVNGACGERCACGESGI